MRDVFRVTLRLGKETLICLVVAIDHEEAVVAAMRTTENQYSLVQVDRWPCENLVIVMREEE